MARWHNGEVLQALPHAAGFALPLILLAGAHFGGWWTFLPLVTLRGSLPSYQHFAIEHVYGHHRRVATKEDPATMVPPLWRRLMAGVQAAPVTQQRIWIAPGPGTLDYLRLFERPEEWRRTRELITVFKFYQQHTQLPPASIVGPNTYDAFVRVNAFRTLRAWGKKTAIELGSVKEGYCTADASGMALSIRSAIDTVAAVEAAGGTVEYLAQDEPWVAGRLRVCGGPALEPTADRVAAWTAAVRQRYSQIQIGLIEAYPFSSAAAIETILELLRTRAATPAFLHIDVDWHALRPGDFARDLPRLKEAARARGITFGVIVWGYNGDADALFARDAADVTNLMTDAFQTWDEMPEQIVFQSWAESATGRLITPSNLPEDRPYALTHIVWDLYRRLRGATGGAVGRAVPRR